MGDGFKSNPTRILYLSEMGYPLKGNLGRKKARRQEILLTNSPFEEIQREDCLILVRGLWFEG